MHIKPRFACAFAVILALACTSQVAHTESTQSGRRARVLITQNIDEAKLVMLRGNVRPEASAVNDRGAVPENFAMEHMLLQLQRPPELEKELEAVVKSDLPLGEVVALLRRYRDRGIGQAEAYAFLERLHHCHRHRRAARDADLDTG